MIIYFAPLEGITDVYFRRVHYNCFTGISKYYIPFISPTTHLTFSSREQSAISPALNEGIPVVPQILTRDAELFLRMANLLQDSGYREVNLNMGCPSGTVTAKWKGASMLRDLKALKVFLDQVYENSPIPVSIKTRIGFEKTGEWQEILKLLADYPIHELVIHPRTREEFYKGSPHNELYAQAFEALKVPIICNGNLFAPDDCYTLAAQYPGAYAFMAGRGLVANPALAQELTGGKKLSLESLRNFHDALLDTYMQAWPPNAVLGHMHEIMSYMVSSFDHAQKPAKAIRKSSSMKAYQDAVDWLFEDCPLKEKPSFEQA